MRDWSWDSGGGRVRVGSFRGRMTKGSEGQSSGGRKGAFEGEERESGVERVERWSCLGRDGPRGTV